jgi:hypothetical protein
MLRAMGSLHTMTLDALTIDDAEAFADLGLYRELERVVREGGLRFRVAREGSAHATWSRVLFLNLTFWHGTPTEAGREGTADVLCERRIPADVVAHVGWHHLAAKALGGRSAEAALLGEAIASAFDLYLLGTTLRTGRASSFEETQTEAMAAALAEHGYDERDVSRWLEEVAEEPERAFESLRALLFDVSTGLLSCETVDDAVEVFDRHGRARFAPLLHHFELSNWVLHTRAHGLDRTVDAGVRAVDAGLRAHENPLEWLREAWVLPALSPPAPART